jgi:hypothetical protein
MKTLNQTNCIIALLFCSFIFIQLQSIAQSPQKLSYQAVIRNSSNALVTNTTVKTRVSILQGSATGTAVYVETHTPTTNANGLVSIEIGGGTVVSGTFSTINWANGPYFVKTETDPAGGTNYSITSSQQLLSVPFALHSITSENATTEISNRIAADNALQTNITNEANVRIAGDNSLKTKVISDSTFLKGLINTNTYDISTEITNRINADNTLQNQINATGLGTEITNRINADNALNAELYMDSTYLKTLIDYLAYNLATHIYDGTIIDNNLQNDLTYQSGLLNGKENTITAGTSSQYWRGDKTFQTLNTTAVTEGTNLYFTSARARSSVSATAPLIYNSTTGVFGMNLANSTTNGYLSSTDWNTFNNKSSGYIAGTGISLNGSTISNTGDLSSTNELQTISRSHDTIFLSNGGFVKLPASHYIGELFGGGIIVSVWKVSGVEHGLIASLADISTGAAWSNVTSTLIGPTAQSPIDGQANTNAIIGQSGQTSSAAKLCDDYTNPSTGTGVYSDWYLPASWELNQCYDAAFVANTILGATNGFQFAVYWSSVEDGSSYAYGQTFGYGYTGYYDKYNSTNYVRAVRRF